MLAEVVVKRGRPAFEGQFIHMKIMARLK
jgi:hypothetical protein